MKKAGELPAAFWESYSAFCNTSGGWILLGVIEGNPVNTIQGVGNISKTQINLWDMLSNPNKINYRTTARDLHVFIVQANTSIYGDSRITGPFGRNDRNVLQIKGGDK